MLLPTLVIIPLSSLHYFTVFFPRVTLETYKGLVQNFPLEERVTRVLCFEFCFLLLNNWPKNCASKTCNVVFRSFLSVLIRYCVLSRGFSICSCFCSRETLKCCTACSSNLSKNASPEAWDRTAKMLSSAMGGSVRLSHPDLRTPMFLSPDISQPRFSRLVVCLAYCKLFA